MKISPKQLQVLWITFKDTIFLEYSTSINMEARMRVFEEIIEQQSEELIDIGETN